jgi:hypothetical protein
MPRSRINSNTEDENRINVGPRIRFRADTRRRLRMGAGGSRPRRDPGLGSGATFAALSRRSLAAGNPRKRRRLECVGSVSEQRLDEQHDRPKNREFAARRSEIKALPDEPKVRRPDHERHRIETRPADIDARYEQKRADELGGDRVPRHEPRISVGSEISPPCGKATRQNKKFPVEVCPEQNAQRQSKQQRAVRRGLLVKHDNPPSGTR